MMILFFVEVFNIVRPPKRAKFHLGNSCSNELVSLRTAFFTAFLWHKNIFSHIDLLQEGVNGVNRQPSNGLKFNRQPSKKDIFTVKRLKCAVILTAKAFKGISNLTIWTSRTLGSWKISSLDKPGAMFSKTISLNITRPYNLLIC